jgi:hypothetical protein
LLKRFHFYEIVLCLHIEFSLEITIYMAFEAL